jgi:hypothetical protein
MIIDRVIIADSNSLRMVSRVGYFSLVDYSYALILTGASYLLYILRICA